MVFHVNDATGLKVSDYIKSLPDQKEHEHIITGKYRVTRVEKKEGATPVTTRYHIYLEPLPTSSQGHVSSEISSKVGKTMDPIRMQAMLYVAHDSGDGQTIYHCPFCGSGQVVGRSDGTVECSFCHTHFTVQVQPEFQASPQTIDGEPQDMEGMPGGVDPNEAPVVPGEGDDAGMVDPAASQDEEEAEGAEDAPEGDNPFSPKSSAKTAMYVTLDGDGVLSEDAFLRHLAIHFADDVDSVLAKAKVMAANQSVPPVWYHGTSSKTLKATHLRSPHLTDDPKRASYYAGEAVDEIGGQPTVLKVHVRDHSKLNK